MGCGLTRDLQPFEPITLFNAKRRPFTPFIKEAVFILPFKDRAFAFDIAAFLACILPFKTDACPVRILDFRRPKSRWPHTRPTRENHHVGG